MVMVFLVSPESSRTMRPSFIMMKDGRIVLELSGDTRKTITTEQLLQAFRQQGLDNDRILFSAE